MLIGLFAMAAALGCCGAADAADYPDRPIILVIPLPAGGTNEIMARAVADKTSIALAQRTIIEYRNAGGSGTVGTRKTGLQPE
jgi:tripartite-type tricarboxylate transporter receptor subunit TctC